jgi:hypothetical protein
MVAAFALLPASLVPIANALDDSAATNSGASSGMPNAPTKDEFLSLQGAAFRVTRKGSATQWLSLVSVEDIATTGAISTDAFSVRFYGGSGKPLPQNTYTFTNSKTGKFQLFIVPSGDAQRFYTAIFNRL